MFEGLRLFDKCISQTKNVTFNVTLKDNIELAITIWTASSEFGTYRLCEQRRFRRACASAQSRQNLRCSLIQAVNQEELSARKQDPWPLWMAGHAQLKFVKTECSKTQIRSTGLILNQESKKETGTEMSEIWMKYVLPQTKLFKRQN